MTFKQTMATLKKMGTAQNVKIYKRHGAGDNLFGVSFANLKLLKKQIKIDHELAEQLWNTGNSDAQTLATMIADPDALTVKTADAWVKGITSHSLGCLFADMIARSKLAAGRMKNWMKLQKEMTRCCGYSVLCTMLRNDADQLDDSACEAILETIEAQIHESANYARHSMIIGLIAIGIYKPRLQKTAIAASRRIGKVDVDHGETSCKTPAAEPYILKAAKRKSAKKKSGRV